MENLASTVTEMQYAMDTFYFLVCGALVMWMAAGFAMLEAGLVRSKNTTEILLKNISLYAVACTMYMVCGYSIMYGGGEITTFLSGIVGDGVAGEVRHGLHDLRIMRVQRAREHRALAAGDAGRHRHRFPARGRSVVERGIRHRTAIETRHLRLELEQHLERALRDFRLIRRVGGQEFAALNNVIHARWHMMLICACAQEKRAMRRSHILEGKFRKMPLNRHFAGMVGKAGDRSIQLRLCGHINEQIINRLCADDAKHRLPVGWG